MKTKKLSVNTICVRGGYTPKNGEPIERDYKGWQGSREEFPRLYADVCRFQESESWHEESV